MSSLSQKATPTNEADFAATALFGLNGAAASPLGGGRVNETFLVESSSGCFVLQKLTPFFGDSEAPGSNWQMVFKVAEEHAQDLFPEWPKNSLPLPPIFPAKDGRILAFCKNSQARWRLTGYLPSGPAPAKTPASALSAARLLGRFHKLLNTPAPLPLAPLPAGEFTNQRLCRPEDFEQILKTCPGHPRLEAITPLFLKAADEAGRLPSSATFITLFKTYELIIHGDPKADNFLFNNQGQAVALLDWDTVGLGQLLIDVAELLRSWVITFTGGQPGISLPTLSAIMAGYGQSGLNLSQEELGFLPPVLRAIALNLCRRYLTDALAENYFKWDRANYSSLYEQNCKRAEGLLMLASKVRQMEIAMADACVESYAQGREKMENQFEKIND